MRGLGPRIVDDQYLVGLVLRHVSQHFNALKQVRGIQAAGEELLATRAHSRQARHGVGVFRAKEQQWDRVFQAFLHAFG